MEHPVNSSGPVERPHLIRLRSTNDLIAEQLTIGQRVADQIAQLMGSWPFIISQTVFLTVWIAVNISAWVHRWDPYPFILLNLLLSTQAAFTAPMIMMSQNRQAAHDRIDAHNDYLINQKAEAEIRAVMKTLEAQQATLDEIRRLLTEKNSG